MARSFHYAGQWLDHDGKHVLVNGIAYTIHAYSYEAQYPVRETMVSVQAEMCNKQSKTYRDVKKQLGDDWSIDVLGGDVESEVAFLQAARAV